MALPIIFISYSHKDRRWLEFVQGHLQVAVTNDHFETWDDRRIEGGADWAAEIDAALSKCAAFILLVSRHSLVSSFILKEEVKAALEAHWVRGVKIYPIVVQACDIQAVPWLTKMNIRPRDAKALALYPSAKREEVMASLAAEIRDIVKNRSTSSTTLPPAKQLINYTGLPETGYERLVGRDAELKRLDEAWADRNTNILSLVAEGGAGKSALVNEWLKRMQADHYRGADAVLGWSFYSQGSKERATSAEPFLNWALDKLGIEIETISAPAKGEAIAENLARRRVLLVLDGCEPLQHGLGTQQGELKDLGLRALLRRFAAMPPAEGHGLVVLTSRQAVKDISRWKDSAAPVLDVGRLSDEAGAALLRDNGGWGTDAELRAAARAFGGHPLALGLLASFLKETRAGDVRRRDHIRELLDDPENPRHDHARRVMESYEAEWLAGQPAPHAIMHMVGLFDRPASGDCLSALRRNPAIPGLTDAIIDLDEGVWQRAVTRLRDVRLLAPQDRAAPLALDAHPLVREWFGQRLERANLEAWRAAHSRLYEHLRDTTQESETPTLEDLAPLYQAIPHGCRAGRYSEALRLYKTRIYKDNYTPTHLNAHNSDLAALSWFFDKPFKIPVVMQSNLDEGWILHVVARCLRAQARLAESIDAVRLALSIYESRAATERHWRVWSNAATNAAILNRTLLLIGDIAASVEAGKRALTHAHASGWDWEIAESQSYLANAMHAAGRLDEATELFAGVIQLRDEGEHEYLPDLSRYFYCDLLLAKCRWQTALVMTKSSRRKDLDWARQWLPPRNSTSITMALDTLVLGQGHFGLALSAPKFRHLQRSRTMTVRLKAARSYLDEAVNGLTGAGARHYLPKAFLARAALRCSVGDWDDAGHDLDEVEEIAEPGPMRLYLCDIAIERARLAFARIAAFAPLNGLIDDGPPKPEPPGAEEGAKLAEEARANLATARELIERCGYHRCDEELAELEAVRDGRRRFADLPPRV